MAVALGYTMQATVAAWLMATLTTSALMVALVQTASTAPSLLLGLLAGTLADIVNRRRIILATQLVLLAATASLGISALFGLLGPVALLIGTFLIGAGFTIYLPAQQASINDLVTRADLPRALGLGAVAFNLARAVGPALAGALAAWVGSGSALLTSALFFAVMIVALRGWRGSGNAIPGVPETLWSGIQSGLRYARHSPPMRALILRNLTFCTCASALWALLPVIARDQLGLGAGGFGLLSASLGIGAIIGALYIPPKLHRIPLNTVVTAGVALWVVATLVIAAAENLAIAVAGACVAGAAWVSVLACLSAGTQSTAPGWVRARAVAMYLVSLQTSLASGAVLWGWLASFEGTRITLAVSSGTMLALFVLSYRIRIRMGDEADVTLGRQPPELAIAIEPLPNDGPVLIQVEYQISPENREAFLNAIQQIEPIRRRNGASDWRVFRDLGEDGRFVERFIIKSWAEYVRVRARMTIADRQIHEHIGQFQQPSTEIRVTRLIGATSRDAFPAPGDIGSS